MTSSRINFKSMFLISENYFNELKDKQKEENEAPAETPTETPAETPAQVVATPEQEESLEPSAPIATTSAPDPTVSTPPPPPAPAPAPEPTISTSLSEDEWSPNQEPSSIQETVNKEENGEYKSIVDKVNSFNCSVCNEAFETEADMVAHQTRNHPDLECKICKREFKNKRELDSHITESHEFGRQSSTFNRSSRRLVNKRAREEDDDDDEIETNNDKMLKRRKIRVSERNKRAREPDEEEKPTTAKKVKVQLQNVENIKDIRQKERKEINNSIGDQHKVKAISYPESNSSLWCDKCQKEFNSLYEFRDHQMYH